MCRQVYLRCIQKQKRRRTMRMLLVTVMLLIAVPAFAQNEVENVEEYIPLYSLTKWSRGGISLWWKYVQVVDERDGALAEVRIRISHIEYRVEYPCRGEDGNIIPHIYQTVVWERGNEKNGIFTDCGKDPVSQEVPLIATKLLGVPPEFYMWGMVKFGS